jgi:ABC-type multidrug transport system ATPase subunit
LGDVDVLRDKDATRRVLGYLPQDFGLYPKVRAEEMLDHLALLKGVTRNGERRDMVQELLRRTNLWSVRSKPLGTFSGGMKQRFGIAQALLASPKLVIVDEPTAGLDPEERVRFHNLLSEIGESIIVILSTHIVGDVTDVCQSMAILHQGKVLSSGRPDQAVQALAGRVWQKTVQRGLLGDLEKEHAVISTRLVGGRTRVRVLSGGAPDASFEPAEADLEDVYFAAIKGLGRG